MTGYSFIFGCPHCAHTIDHRGNMRQGVAACHGCGAEYRIDVAVKGLRGPQLTEVTTHGRRNPDAEGASLITALMERAA